MPAIATLLYGMFDYLMIVLVACKYTYQLCSDAFKTNNSNAYACTSNVLTVQLAPDTEPIKYCICGFETNLCLGYFSVSLHAAL